MKFRVFLCLGFCAGCLWAQTLRNYGRFQSAMELRLRACTAIRSGLPALGASLLEQAWSIDPSQRDIAPDLAACYCQLGHWQSARGVLDRAIRESRSHPGEVARAYANRGHFLLRLGALPAACQDLRIARRLEPTNPLYQRDWARAERLLLAASLCALRSLQKCKETAPGLQQDLQF